MKKKTKILLLLMHYPLLLSASGLAYALPEHQNTVAGSIVLDASVQNTLNIHQGTSNAIVNWNSFNIGNGETVNVFQPSSSSILLNRVLDANPTQILGNLNANGHVWIMNAGGVLFGENSQVNVGGLIATTADIDNDDFMAGNYQFHQAGVAGTSIVNEGTIRADNGFVGLFASTVSNKGTIQANLGKIVLAATETYTLDFYGDGLFNIALDDLDANTAQAASYNVTNEGNVIAQAGHIEMTVAQGNATVERIIENKWTGKIEANSVGTDKQGRIVLGGGTNDIDNNTTVLVAGHVSARGKNAGQKGGTVKITGDRIAVLQDAKIDASGDAGGGTIHIGGEYLGQGDTKTARATIIQKDSLISANGGDGRVIVWSDEYTNFNGTIEANGGNGFVETSSKEILSATGRVYVTGGLWLLDPGNIDVRNDAGGGPDDSTIAGPVFDSAGVASVVTTEAIEAALVGADVTILTSGGGGGAGNITVTDMIEYFGATEKTLTFKASEEITFNNATINSTTGALNVVLWADYDRVSDATGISAVSITNTTITTNGGDFIIGGGANPYTDAIISHGFTGGIYTGNFVLSTGAGLISMKGTAGTLYNNTAGFRGGIRLAGGTDLTTTTGNISLEGINWQGGTDNVGLWLEGTDLQTVSGSIDLVGTTTIDNTNNRGVIIWIGSSILQTGTGTVGDINITGSSGSSATSGVQFSDTASMTLADANLNITAYNGGIYFTGPIIKNAGTTSSIQMNSENGIQMVDQFPGTEITSTTGALNISLDADSDGDGTGSLSADTTNFDSNGGDISFGGAAISLNAVNIIANAAGVGNITLNTDALAMTATAIDAGQNVTITPRTVSSVLNIGAGVGALDISSAELAMIAAGNALILGDSAAGTGNVFIDSINVAAGGYDLEVHGGDITVDNGLTGGGTIFLNARANSDITVNDVITSAGAGNSLILNANGNFINNHGVGALDPDTGRFLVYTTNVDNVVFNGLSGDQIQGQTISSLVPASVPGVNNSFIFSYAPPAPAPVAVVTTPPVPVPVQVLTDPHVPTTQIANTGGNPVLNNVVEFQFNDIETVSGGLFSDLADLGEFQNYFGDLNGQGAVVLNENGYGVAQGNYSPLVGDYLRTGAEGGFMFESDESSIIKMTRRSSLQVKKVFFSPDGKEDVYYDVKDGAVGFFSDRDKHKGEIKTILPGIAIKVTGTCYIVDNDKVADKTNITLFGGGIELYILGQLVKLKDPIQMISFGKDKPLGEGGKIVPIPLTMTEVRKMFSGRPEIIPGREQLLKCGVPEASI